MEPVRVVDAMGNATLYPDLSYRNLEVTVDYINKLLGLALGSEAIRKLLGKMQIESTAAATSDGLSLQVPPTRSDVLHACDVMEDVAIAYGYNNIPNRIPPTVTQGKELPINQLTEMLRQECAMAGFTEILTWALCSKAENFDFLRSKDDGTTAVEIGNPATFEFEVCRTMLLPSALKTLGANKDAPLPIKLFEVSDAVMLSSDHDVGARNERRLVAVYSNKESGFEVVHGMLNRIMDMLGVPYKGEAAAPIPPPILIREKLPPLACTGSDSVLEAKAGGSYHWEPSEEPAFFPGRQACVKAFGRVVGHFGVVHPEVLEKFEIPYPVSALEISIEPFCFDQQFRPLLVSIV